MQNIMKIVTKINKKTDFAAYLFNEYFLGLSPLLLFPYDTLIYEI